MSPQRPDPLRHVMPGPKLAVAAEALFLIRGLNAHGIFPDWIALNNGTTHGLEASDAGIQVELTAEIHKALEPFPGLSPIFQIRVEPLGTRARIHFLVETLEESLVGDERLEDSLVASILETAKVYRDPR